MVLPKQNIQQLYFHLLEQLAQQLSVLTRQAKQAARAEYTLLDNQRYDAITIAAVADDEPTLKALLAAGAAMPDKVTANEAALAGRLNHPHIVAIHDVGEHQGAVWLAMEYVDGETFAAWAKQRPRTWREVVAVLICAARGLCAAHEAGLVHRDIKPDNIMVGHDGRVRVMDLGLARALARDDEPAQEVSIAARTAAAGDLAVLAARVTRVGAVMGTPAYMSPEQFRGVPVDARADVFSLCVTLWEALHGERPFAGDTLVELAAHVLSGTVRAPSGPQARRVPGWPAVRHSSAPSATAGAMSALPVGNDHETPVLSARPPFTA